LACGWRVANSFRLAISGTETTEGAEYMLRFSKFFILMLLLSPAMGFAAEVPSGDAPAFTAVPELNAGFDLLYEQKFAEARQVFTS
jgi:hypothetical protein